MSSAVYTQREVYDQAVAVAFATGRGAIKGVFFASVIASLGLLYAYWKADFCVSERSISTLGGILGAVVVLPSAGALIGGASAAVSSTTRILKKST